MAFSWRGTELMVGLMVRSTATENFESTRSRPIPAGVDENEAPTVVADGANAVVANSLSIVVGGYAIVANSPVVGDVNRYWTLSRLDTNGNEDPLFAGGTVILDETEGGRINRSRPRPIVQNHGGRIETNGISRAAIGAINGLGEIDASCSSLGWACKAGRNIDGVRRQLVARVSEQRWRIGHIEGSSRSSCPAAAARVSGLCRAKADAELRSRPDG